MFVLMYDEWGGFFDHVEPPLVPDDRASSQDANNFGQLGFRIPSVLASPYAPRNYVDHSLYDHTSILRFLEWRFLGAPPTGPGRHGDKWFLTTRDRNANNFGASLRAGNPDPEVDVEAPLAAIPPTTGGCNQDRRLREVGPDRETNTFEVSDELEAVIQQRIQGSTYTPWLKFTDIHDLPALPDDHPR
jgi:hypothetical protein